MMLPSQAHVSCILNGHRITQWADANPPYELEFEDIVNQFYGHDGTHYPMSSSNLGGTLILQVVPHSVDSKWLLDREKDRQSQIINQGKGTSFSGILADVVTQIRVSLEGGYLIQTDRFPVAGQPFRCAFAFERIIPEYDNAKPFSRFGVYPGANESVSGGVLGREDIDRQDFPGTGP